MDIDVEQLPIPDWNLQCRTCGYPLKGLPEHRCPECGRRIVMSEFVQTWTRLRDPQFTGGELPLPDFGLSCAKCEAPLAGAAQHRCPSCHTPFKPQRMVPEDKWYKVPPALLGDLPAQVVETILGDDFIPYIRRERRDLSVIYGFNPHSDARFEIPPEFYYDLLAALRRPELAAADPNDPDWTCPHCHEPNPPTFKSCWKCQRFPDTQRQE